ncbi:MAG: FAD-dependent oxidoreductase [Bacteroidota bacterium]
MISYWEQTQFLNYDFIIVGSGITGLSCAAEIKEQYPTAKVLVLERGLLPTGASTKNAGFACFGTLTEMVYDISVMGEANLLKLVQDRIAGLQILRNRLGDDKIEYINNGGYELIIEKHNHDELSAQLEHLNKLLFPLFKQEVFLFDDLAADDFGFDKQLVKRVIRNPLEGQINTGKMMQALIEHVTKLGVHIITGAEVLDIVDKENFVTVSAKGLQQEIVEFTCKKAAICTNAFTKKLFPILTISPGRGQVLVTKPIDNLKIKGTFSFDEGFYYFRNIDNRIIFGGGRNLAFEEETTTAFEINIHIQDELKRLLKTLILPNTPFEIDYEWCGIMAFGEDKLPIIQKQSKNVVVGARLNGMGVALGSKIAKDVVSLLEN